MAELGRAADSSDASRTARGLPLSAWGVLVVALLGVLGVVYLLVSAQSTHVTVFVPLRDLPAYHLIQREDLVEMSVRSATLSTESRRSASDIVDRYSLGTLVARQPVSQEQLSPPFDRERLAGTVEIAIAATTASSLGGAVRSGDTVDVLLAHQPPDTPSVYEDLPVLYVRPSGESFTIVVALPAAQRQEFAARSVGAAALITRKRL
jgi:Flp pilus assembly protein CpaB